MTVNKIQTSKGAMYLMDFYDVYDNADNAPVRFDAFDKSGETVINNLTQAEAHEIADWIKANVPIPPPPPKPTTLELIRELPEGTAFKIDTFEWTYVRLTGGQMLFISPTGKTHIQPDTKGGWGHSHYGVNPL